MGNIVIEIANKSTSATSTSSPMFPMPIIARPDGAKAEDRQMAGYTSVVGQ